MTTAMLMLLGVLGQATGTDTPSPEEFRDGIEICNDLADFEKRWRGNKAQKIEVVIDGKTVLFCKVHRDVVHQPSDRRVQGKAQPGKRLRSGEAAGNPTKPD